MAHPNELERLPAEMLDQIFQRLPKSDLASLRLVSRFLEERARVFLFRQLTLHDSNASAAKVSKIIRNDSLMGLVREFQFIASYFDRVC